MKISIITATYNRADTITDTIKSLISQTYQNWEHIIIDGASKDDTLSVIEQFKNQYNGRLKLISEKDNGIYDAMNKGIALASGDYIGFLNSDDFYYDNDVLSKIVEQVKEHPTDCVFGGTIVVDGINTDKIIWISKGSPYPKRGFSSGWHPSHPTFYAKRECYIKFGNFDLDFGTAADLEIMLRFIEGHHITCQYIPMFFNKMRFGGASNNTLSAIIKSNKNVLRAFEKNGLDKPKFYIVKKMLPKFLNRIKTKLGITSKY